MKTLIKKYYLMEKSNQKLDLHSYIQNNNNIWRLKDQVYIFNKLIFLQIFGVSYSNITQIDIFLNFHNEIFLKFELIFILMFIIKI